MGEGETKTIRPSEIDVVYTWVDDMFPGYAETLEQFATTRHDTNPNRTRDNLEMLRYSLRSLERHVPFVRRVHLLTCRPQVPEWLNTDHPDITVMHHDEIMAPEILPTFNSFAIISHLAKLPCVSEHFLYCEDDMLFLSKAHLSDFVQDDGRLRVFAKNRDAPVHAKTRPGDSPWNLSLANANAALDRAFGPRRRKFLAHGPRLIERRSFEEMCNRFGHEIAATRASRFRGGDNVPPEYLYPHYLLETEEAVLASDAETRRVAGYASIDNFLPWTWLQLARLDRLRPVTATLNDNFNDRPNPRVVAHVRNRLNRWFPEPSRFERLDRPPT
ncbi:stealth conserved region 3 domain-containing protein [Stappia sp. ES.058]|uniref:stealth conserved region 3 domain-containing protein n=1 Tax=Stappia sp. ES.058 TaxID=1881061 RepID=UPI00087DE1DC|nr:stealth conserved region 3 domain-containing protein [Stappia sp. ES.058]SDU33675.1 Stealth protein CR3, conserved region 3 [Stappia sp. ES.058]